ncbi:hypothetical protein SDC9_147393 [bioreactor metagenome]|uniref:Uncharacterized protein n=1 Tax=bioreactor metagenome TaxID=1076179 RepID=A0A645EGD3_9ZZZZ
MSNFDEMVEKYKKELMTIAKKNPQSNVSIVQAKPKDTENSLITVHKQEDTAKKAQNGSREIKIYESYDDFKNEQTDDGSMTVKVYVANQAMPLKGARVVISKALKNYDEILFDGYTDHNGMIENVVLPASSRELLEEENKHKPCAMYRVTVTHPDHVKSVHDNISLFDSMQLVHHVNMIPISEAGEDQYYTWIDENNDDEWW